MTTSSEFAARSRIRAFRVDQHVLVVAEGELPTPGYDVDIRQDPRRIFPPPNLAGYREAMQGSADRPAAKDADEAVG